MTKFTFIVEYRRGTYIQQITADSLQSAFQNWATAIDSFNIPEISHVEKELLVEDTKYEEPTKIDRVENVWCVFLKIKRSTLLVNIVATL